MKQMMDEIRNYITGGYPDDYDGMGFGASVDMVKSRLKECTERPRTVAELLTYIETVLRCCGGDLRLPPSVTAYLVRQGIVTFNDRNGNLTWLDEMPESLCSKRVRKIEGMPKGRTIFESYWCGGFPCREGGVFVYYDGRVYSLADDIRHRISHQWTLVATSEPLVADIKKLINDNWNSIKETPERIDCGMPIIDGGTQQYKFRGKYFYRDVVVEPQSLFIESLNDQVSRLFVKHNVNVSDNMESLGYFVDGYCGQMDEILDEEAEPEDRNEKISEFLDGDFPEECRNLGFEMDCGHGFEEKYGSRFFDDPETSLEEKFAKVDDFLLLGDMIFSRWRELNHWSYNSWEEFDAKWFKAALMRLKELGGPTDEIEEKKNIDDDSNLPAFLRMNGKEMF